MKKSVRKTGKTTRRQAGRLTGLLAPALLMTWVLPAGAEESFVLDPVLVTAEKRTENVQDVPVSVSAISEQQVEDAGGHGLSGDDGF